MIVIRDNLRLDLVDDLARIILARSHKVPSFPSKNVGGWKSSEALFLWCDAGEQAIAALRSSLVDEINSLRGIHIERSPLVGWAMINKNGSAHPRHQHYRTIITGLYYVASGDEPARLDVSSRAAAPNGDAKYRSTTPTIFELEQRDLSDEALALPMPDACSYVQSVRRGPNGKMIPASEMHVFPVPGRLVLFPGDQWHAVPAVTSEAPRITIAFDVRY